MRYFYLKQKKKKLNPARDQFKVQRPEVVD